MRRVKIIVGALLHKIARGCNFFKKEYYKSQLNSCGKDVYWGNNVIATYKNISIGNHVYIGSNSVLQSAHGRIEIGNHVMFGPGVHIHGGNHVYDKVGVYMDLVKKADGSDGTVLIEDDVWIGSNAIILQGIHVGCGSIIGAGAVVTKDVPAGSIVAGNPARIIGERFKNGEFEEHKKYLDMHKKTFL